MNQFAVTLKNILDERGLTQKWLADHANTKEATISRYVNGINKSPNTEILIEISKALGVTTDYLLGLSDIPCVKSDFTSEEFMLIKAFRRASERDAKLVHTILDEYIKG